MFNKIKDHLDIVFTIVLILLILVIAKASLVLKTLILALGLFLYLYINIFLHELGHFAAAKLVGFKVTALSIGDGKEFYRKKWKDVLVTASLGACGYTTVQITDRKHLRLRLIVTYLGGMFVNGLILLLLCYITEFNIKSGKDGVTGMLVIVSSSILLMCMIPFSTKSRGVKRPNDGRAILNLLFIKADKLEEFLGNQESIEAYQLCQNKEFSLAIKIYEELIHKGTASDSDIINYSFCLASCNSYDKARNALLQLLDGEHNKEKDVLIMNNLAWYYLLDFSDDSIVKADKFSLEAFKLDSKQESILSTRGCVLIELGEVDLGIEMVKRSISMNKSRGKEGQFFLVYAFLAYGYCKLGNKAEMDKCLQYLDNHRNNGDSERAFLYERLSEKTNGFEIA